MKKAPLRIVCNTALLEQSEKNLKKIDNLILDVILKSIKQLNLLLFQRWI